VARMQGGRGPHLEGVLRQPWVVKIGRSGYPREGFQAGQGAAFG